MEVRKTLTDYHARAAGYRPQTTGERYNYFWRQTRFRFNLGRLVFDPAAIEQVRKSFDFSSGVPVPSMDILPTGVICRLADSQLAGALRRDAETLLAAGGLAPADYWLTPVEMMHVTVVSYWSYRYSAPPIAVIPPAKLATVQAVVDRLKVRPQPFTVRGIMMTKEGCILAKGYLPEEEIARLRQELVGALGLHPNLRSIMDHVSLGRIFRPLTKAEFSPVMDKLVRHDRLILKDYGQTILDTLGLGLDGPTIKLTDF